MTILLSTFLKAHTHPLDNSSAENYTSTQVLRVLNYPYAPKRTTVILHTYLLRSENYGY